MNLALSIINFINGIGMRISREQKEQERAIAIGLLVATAFTMFLVFLYIAGISTIPGK
jgi:hypothetical protein